MHSKSGVDTIVLCVTCERHDKNTKLKMKSWVYCLGGREGGRNRHARLEMRG